MRAVPKLALALAATLALLGGVAAAPAPTSAPAATVAGDETPDWAPADEASIRPGVQTVTAGGQCTSNFIFYDIDLDHDGDGTPDEAQDIYIGQAAHCATTGGSTSTNGCETGSREIGTEVEVDGAEHPGELVYSSWLTMQEVGETDGSTCAYNDFALVKLDPRDHDTINPSIPAFGGPVGVEPDGTAAGDDVFTYGNSGLRFGVSQLSPKRGKSVGTSGDGWTHTVYTATPGIPGDSGSAMLDQDGDALGVVVTVALAPFPASNGVTDVSRALQYANDHTGLDVALAAGTEDFDPPLIPIG